jgi:HAD superfamily hydrolase (TIGR01484 family)
MKKVVAFDLDGTLTESKTDIDSEMVSLLARLQKIKKVAVIGGATLKQFQKQFVDYLDCFENLFLLPTSGASFFKYENSSWQPIYQLFLTDEEKRQVFDAFEKTFKDLNYHNPEKTYGEIIEDRGTEIAFSTLGQQAPLEARKALKPDEDRRPEIIASLRSYLPNFKITLTGINTIDITRMGIDKGFAIEQIAKVLEVTIPEIIFIGDAIFADRNDFEIVRTGVDFVRVSGPADTKRFIQSLLVIP